MKPAVVLLAITLALGAAHGHKQSGPQFRLAEGTWYGTAKIKCTVAADGTFRYNVIQPVVIESTTPPTVTDPTDPTEPTDPIVPQQVGTLVVVYETGDQAIPLHVHTVRDELPLSVNLLVLDKDTPTERYAAALTAGVANGLPALVLLGEDGLVIETMDLPDTAEAILDYVN